MPPCPAGWLNFPNHKSEAGPHYSRTSDSGTFLASPEYMRANLARAVPPDGTGIWEEGKGRREDPIWASSHAALPPAPTSPGESREWSPSPASSEPQQHHADVFPVQEASLHLGGLPQWLSGKEPAYHHRRHGFNPWSGKITWRRKWQLTPAFLSAESHGQGSLADYGSCGHKRVGHDWATER